MWTSSHNPQSFPLVKTWGTSQCLSELINQPSHPPARPYMFLPTKDGQNMVRLWYNICDYPAHKEPGRHLVMKTWACSLKVGFKTVLQTVWLLARMVSNSKLLYLKFPCSFYKIKEEIIGKSAADFWTPVCWSELESIQGTCRLSLKMGRGDEQKTVMYCIWR